MHVQIIIICKSDWSVSMQDKSMYKQYEGLFCHLQVIRLRLVQKQYQKNGNGSVQLMSLTMPDLFIILTYENNHDTLPNLHNYLPTSFPLISSVILKSIYSQAPSPWVSSLTTHTPPPTPPLSSSLTMNIIFIQAQLVRAWQAICHVAGLSPSLSHCHCFLFRFISHLSFSMTLTSVKVWLSSLNQK